MSIPHNAGPQQNTSYQDPAYYHGRQTATSFWMTGDNDQYVGSYYEPGTKVFDSRPGTLHHWYWSKGEKMPDSSKLIGEAESLIPTDTAYLYDMVQLPSELRPSAPGNIMYRKDQTVHRDKDGRLIAPTVRLNSTTKRVTR